MAVARARVRLSQEAPDRIDLVRVLRADPWAAALVWLRRPAVVAWFAARVAAADLTEPHWAVPPVELPADLRAELDADLLCRSFLAAPSSPRGAPAMGPLRRAQPNARGAPSGQARSP